MKRGFTLIELLAVIVILSIISLIVTPTIAGTIEKVKKEVFITSAYSLVKAGKLYYMEQEFDSILSSMKIFEIENGRWSNNRLSVDGQLPGDGKVILSEDGKVALMIFNGVYCAVKEFDDEEISLFDDLSEDDCLNMIELRVKYVEELLNGADPELKGGMIPVVISSDGIVSSANIYNSVNPWYKYENKLWANAVLVTESIRSDLYENGRLKENIIIKETDILAYLVWIPRYEYSGLMIDTTYVASGGTYIEKSKEIDIVFQDVSVKTKDTHSAFTFGNIELNGFWVGKFESGFDQNNDIDKKGSTSNWTTALADGTQGGSADVADVNNLLIKPSIPSWRGINVKKMFDMGLSLSNSRKFGLTVDDTDSHMMKNMEWGAVAYLSHSKYGKNAELNINNCSLHITGVGSSGTSDASSINTCNVSIYDWKSTNGINASTTGNITGIYDMNGGASEHVMAYSKFGGTEGKSSGFSQLEMTKFVDYNTNKEGIYSKYIDLYDYVDNQRMDSSADYTSGKRGDAIVEMGPFKYVAYLSDSISYRSSWYGDYSRFVDSSFPWFLRGGEKVNKTTSGIFHLVKSTGVAKDSNSFRVVIAPVKR